MDGVKEYIKTIGLFNTKAENVIKTCAILLERHGGEVPENREAPRPCPASAARPPTWCSTPPSAGPPSPSTPISSGSPTAPALQARTSIRWRRSCLKVVPAEFKLDVHHWLILHGVTPVSPASPAAALHHRRFVRIQREGLSRELICRPLDPGLGNGFKAVPIHQPGELSNENSAYHVARRRSATFHRLLHPSVGMTLLRKSENSEYKYILAFVGYGDEKDEAVIELTYNWGERVRARFRLWSHRPGSGRHLCHLRALQPQAPRSPANRAR